MIEKNVIRVVLADDHPVVRGGVKNMLVENDDIDVVGEASDGAQALKMVRDLQPDVLLLDMEMPIKPGIEVARDLAQEQHPTRILALSAYDDDEYIFGLLDAGAAGYLTKDEAPLIIVEAVRGVAQGEDDWISRRVADKMVRRRRTHLERNSADLSGREWEVLKLVGKGLTNPEIGDLLFISEGTVKNHVSHIYEKLGFRTRAEAVAWAWEHGLMKEN
ncbi:MAG: response regulator transcription factor [Rhodothermales bacterium]|jgi:DNA-binding NarL/FixJ family response regulator|nr:response regulator transcription factor [Rhodothermales bacterium]HAY36750.1 DNA-binding response regulator [Bacteroidota bacterium]